ncbi:endonuclease NucS domain-containing protein [Shewanella sp.]|uniref:endonuclease NucS domain-containing protein n=1 Tax=Shewanella sp. TaxID=50422 RepID=UPI004053E9E9
MKSEQYRSWLKLQGYVDNTIAAQMHRAGRVESHYGGLDELHAKDGLNSLLVELKYTQADRQNNKPNPTKIPFDGVPYNNLASYRDAIRRYKRFKEEGFVEVDQSFEFEPVDDAIVEDLKPLHSISLEKDMQAALRLNIEQLEPGLCIIDDSKERSVDSGFIDITARDAQSRTVVIELKTGVAGQRAIAQILSYMGDVLIAEDSLDTRGILVAGDFDDKAIAASRVVPNLTLKKYKVEFSFETAE